MEKLDRYTPEDVTECPFCESYDLCVSDEPSQANDDRLYRVYCLNCRATGPIKYNAPESVVAWNTRETITADRGSK